jgi:hypothetical protein
MRIGILTRSGETSYDLADLPEDILRKLGIPADADDPFKRLFPPGLIASVYKPAPIVSSSTNFLSREELTALWRKAVADKRRREAAFLQITAQLASAESPAEPQPPQQREASTAPDGSGVTTTAAGVGLGGAVGAAFDLIGAAPGAVIGGVVGAIGGGMAGFFTGHKVVTAVWDWYFQPLEKEEYEVVEFRHATRKQSR